VNGVKIVQPEGGEPFIPALFLSYFLFFPVPGEDSRNWFANTNRVARRPANPERA